MNRSLPCIVSWAYALSLTSLGCGSQPPPAAPPTPGDSAAAEPANEAPDIVANDVTYPVGDVSMKGYLAYDKSLSGPRPGVLIVHEWWGLNDYARERARMLAKLGYTAFALDMYGVGKRAAHPDQARQFATEVMADAEAARSRFTAALDLLKRHETTDPERVAAIGYCFGGGVVLHMARWGLELDAVVSFHGGLATKTPAQAGAVKARVLVCHGEDDPMVPPDQVAAFKSEMDAAGVAYRVESYAGATHGFTNRRADQAAKQHNLPVAYNAEADAKSWQSMQTLFNAVFGQSP